MAESGIKALRSRVTMAIQVRRISAETLFWVIFPFTTPFAYGRAS